MNPGRLNTAIIFEMPETESTNTRGHAVKSWLFYDEILAKVEYGPSREAIDTYHRVDDQYITVTIRYRKGINSRMRMKIDDEYYYINGVAPDTRKMYMEIDAATKR